MASNIQTSLNGAKFTIPTTHDLEQSTLEIESKEFDYSKRSQWLRAAVLVANDGLVSTASLMMGVAASFIKEYKVRVEVMVGAVSSALVVFGWLGAMLVKAPLLRSVPRVLIGGLLAMTITFGLTKLIGLSGL
ncbi:vacuolar iron transporter homolog 4-like [Quercus lobata]|uniref:Uncharacterized protein n=1 Tax=Quercus lobata TaxID=97700 RepID=A0A7N2N0N4_QUELO|nr:vacuolar iron transporter homolog 4-like [Quercus lobata]